MRPTLVDGVWPWVQMRARRDLGYGNGTFGASDGGDGALGYFLSKSDGGSSFPLYEFSAVDRGGAARNKIHSGELHKGNPASLRACGNSIFLTALYPENYPLRVISAAKSLVSSLGSSRPQTTGGLNRPILRTLYYITSPTVATRLLCNCAQFRALAMRVNTFAAPFLLVAELRPSCRDNPVDTRLSPINKSPVSPAL